MRNYYSDLTIISHSPRFSVIFCFGNPLTRHTIIIVVKEIYYFSHFTMKIRWKLHKIATNRQVVQSCCIIQRNSIIRKFMSQKACRKICRALWQCQFWWFRKLCATKTLGIPSKGKRIYIKSLLGDCSVVYVGRPVKVKSLMNFLFLILHFLLCNLINFISFFMLFREPTRYNNVMHDKRIYRGSNFASQNNVGPCVSQFEKNNVLYLSRSS